MGGISKRPPWVYNRLRSWLYLRKQTMRLVITADLRVSLSIDMQLPRVRPAGGSGHTFE